MIRGKVVGKTQTENLRTVAIGFPSLTETVLVVPDDGEFEIGQEVTLSISAVKCAWAASRAFAPGAMIRYETESERLEAELEPRPEFKRKGKS